MACMVVFFIIVAVVIVLAVAITNAQKTAQKANQAWQQAATTLRLQFVPGALMQPRRIEGKYRDHWIQVDTFRRGSGNNSITYTRYEVSFPFSLELGLRLSEQGFGSQVWTFLGGQDIATWDNEFDSRVVVKGAYPDDIRRVLTPELRADILDLFSVLHECTIDDNRIVCMTRGVEHNGQSLTNTIRRLADIATKMTVEEDYDEEPPALPWAAAQPPVEETPEVVPVKPLYEELLEKESPLEKEIPVVKKVVAKTETVHPHEEIDAAAPPLPTVPPEIEPSPPTPWPPKYALPTRPPVAETPTALESSDKPEETPPTPLETTDELDKTPPTISAEPTTDEVCEALFHADTMTHKINENFNRDFKDKHVSWMGKLENVESYFFDMVFGNEPGLKAIFTIHEIVDTYSTNKVQAVVQLPKEKETELRARVGDDMSFRGRLAGCDGFMRKIFLADGQT